MHGCSGVHFLRKKIPFSPFSSRRPWKGMAKSTRPIFNPKVVGGVFFEARRSFLCKYLRDTSWSLPLPKVSYRRVQYGKPRAFSPKTPRSPGHPTKGRAAAPHGALAKSARGTGSTGPRPRRKRRLRNLAGTRTPACLLLLLLLSFSYYCDYSVIVLLLLLLFLLLFSYYCDCSVILLLLLFFIIGVVIII